MLVFCIYTRFLLLNHQITDIFVFCSFIIKYFDLFKNNLRLKSTDDFLRIIGPRWKKHDSYKKKYVVSYKKMSVLQNGAAFCSFFLLQKAARIISQRGSSVFWFFPSILREVPVHIFAQLTPRRATSEPWHGKDGVLPPLGNSRLGGPRIFSIRLRFLDPPGNAIF